VTGCTETISAGVMSLSKSDVRPEKLLMPLPC